MALAVMGTTAQAGAGRRKRCDDGGVYEGTFRNGLQHGQGSYVLPNGYRYEGDWVEGQIMGRGCAEFPNGSVYEGQFARGKPDGTGKITYADGGTYEGAWAAGEIAPGAGDAPLCQRIRSMKVSSARGHAPGAGAC